MSPLAALRRYARPWTGEGRAGAPGCELCGNALEPGHRHVADLEGRRFGCACRACTLLFETAGAARGRWRTVPDRVLADEASNLTDDDWAALDLPVRLAFLFRNSRAGRWVAFYPGPAGAVESELPLDACIALAARNRLLAAAEPDVEAILAWAGRGERTFRTYLVPVVDCYDLVARVRRTFRGFDGGDELRRELEEFFEALGRRSRPLGPREIR